MADGAVVIGVTAVLTSGVLGPLVLHHAQKERETWTDLRDGLDDAIEALVTTRARLAWLHSLVIGTGETNDGEDQTVREQGEALLREVHALEAHALKLEMRFGHNKIVAAYNDAVGALVEQGWYLFERILGRSSDEEVTKQFEALDDTCNTHQTAVIAAAHRWHADRSVPYLTK